MEKNTQNKSESDFDCSLFHTLPAKEAWAAVGKILPRMNGKTGIIGVVGGAGSGKSSVILLLKQYYAAKIIEWDQIRSKVLENRKVARKLAKKVDSKFSAYINS